MKYELIKEYPRSPKLGKIEDSNIGGITGWQGTLFYDAHPEFWQKVEELDYQILSFIAKTSRRVYDIQGNGKYVGIGIMHNYTSEECLGSDSFSIHSVKRLSDGEVFTIGDEVLCGGNKITEIYITKIKSDSQGIWIKHKHGDMHLNFPSKLKTPLFTTEDGVAIFEGDDFFVIETQFDKYRLHKTIGGHFTKERSTRLRFHSKEKAEEYVLLNKPCLSLTEISKFYKHLLHFNNGNSMGLRNLVKSKL
jgi:hypothetical protein